MIKNVDFQSTMEDAFLKYAASVAQERAIPDVRDMLKIGLRQGLYAQFTNKLTHKDKMQKAQKSVAAAMAQSYIHGDVAMYDTFIRAARPWSYRYPVEDVQGSFGNPSSPDSHAAPRYVEMRAGEIADYFFDGLKKNAIDDQWYSNYDDTELIPSVFPSIGLWNIINGCSGIAVAMATSVPQFNLKEVNEALIKIIRNPQVDFNDIYCAPDFATGGTIINAAQVKESLRCGKGDSIRLRAKLTYIPTQHMIQATELPYGVFTNTVIDQLATLTSEDDSYGIDRVIDHTKKTADIRIYLSKDVNPTTMIAKLYNDTSLEDYFSINMVMLDHGRFPKIFGWRVACDAYIEHIRECQRNIIQFDLDKALARQNIIDGLLIAAANIDDIVAIIRSSSNPAEAGTKLIAKYHFNDEQVKAILAMRLSSLTKIDGIKLNEELEKIKLDITNYQHLLSENTALDEVLIQKLQDISNKFGDTRRTTITDLIEPQETFEEKQIRLSISSDSFTISDSEKKVRTKSTTTDVITTNTDSVVVITTFGQFYSINLASLAFKTYKIKDLIELRPNEKPILITNYHNGFDTYDSVITISKLGLIKKTRINEYSPRCSKRGVAAVKLNDGDILQQVLLVTNDDNKILIVNNNDYYNYYSVNSLTYTGRATKGVKAMPLKDDEFIKNAAIIYDTTISDSIIIEGNTIMLSSLIESTRTSKRSKLYG